MMTIILGTWALLTLIFLIALVHKKEVVQNQDCDTVSETEDEYE